MKMKNKDNKIWWILGIVLLLVAIFNNDTHIKSSEESSNTSLIIHYYESDGSEIWSDGRGGFSPYNPDESNKKNSSGGIINKLMGKESFAIIPYISQCVPENCPSVAGYVQTNLYCNDAASVTNPNTCFRVCETSTQGYITPVIKTCIT